MNRRNFFSTVLGAITAGLGLPWYRRGAEAHTVGSLVGGAPSVIQLPTGEPIRHLIEFDGYLYAFTERAVWVITPEARVHKRTNWYG